MYRSLEKKRMKGNRAQSHAVSANMGVSLQDVLTFFLTDESGVRTDIALRFQAHIEALLHYFTRYNTDRLFIGSSILLIYDNDNSSPHMRWARALQRLHTVSDSPPLSSDSVAALTRRTHVDVRMIDFAHTGSLPRDQTQDLGYIQGLQTILTALKAIRAHRTRPIFSMANAAINAMTKRSSSHDTDRESGDDPDPRNNHADAAPALQQQHAASAEDEECPAFNFSALTRRAVCPFHGDKRSGRLSTRERRTRPHVQVKSLRRRRTSATSAPSTACTTIVSEEGRLFEQ
eukprot:IDg6528t1